MYTRLRKRLTDKRTAEEIRNNVQGLIDAGIEPQKSDLIYLKLAGIEDLQDTEFAYLRRCEEQMKADGRLPEREE